MQTTKTITDTSIEYKTIKPTPKLSDFVENFWMVKNSSFKEHKIITLPDGRFDIIFFYSSNIIFQIMQMGLESVPNQKAIPPKTTMYAVSLRLLAIEYLLDTKTASFLNNYQHLPNGFWEITENDLDDFENFCNKVSTKILELIKSNIDIRKKELFNLIYSSKGFMSVKELSEKVFWSSRQINRYFQENFGISLKKYCDILRFKTSLNHLADGKLYPELNFADQTHFIRVVKKFSGVVPKDLFKNKNDRFILLSTMQKK